MKAKPTLIVTGVLVLSACVFLFANHSGKIPPKECIKLNNDGVKHLMNYSMDEKDELNKAVDLFKQAINCDSTYLTAYENLSNAYNQGNNNSEEMIILNKILILTKNAPTTLVSKGVLFEKMNHLDSAKEIYILAKQGFEKRLKKHPDNIGLIEGMILLKAITDGKDEAIKEVDQQIKLHPELSSKLSFEYEIYEHFERHAYIYNLTTE